MAPKRTADPPPVISSDDVEESGSSSEEEEEQQQQAVPARQSQPEPPAAAAESESEDEEEEENDEEEEEESEDEEDLNDKKGKKTVTASPAPVKPQAQAQAQSQAQAQPPSSESESDDEDEEDEEPLKSPKASDFTIKPISKREPETPKPTPKRRAESSGLENGGPKRPKPTANGDDTPTASEKRPAFNRLWSEEDEIGILNAIIEFRSKSGKDPSYNQTEFQKFIKKFIPHDFSRSQLMDKVRRMKQKYLNYAKKSTNGEDPVISKTHDLRIYRLSKKIWGKDFGSDDANKNNNGSVIRSARKASVADKQQQQQSPPSPREERENLNDADVDDDELVGEDELKELFPWLMKSMGLLKLLGFDHIVNNLHSLGRSELEELEVLAKKLSLKETLHNMEKMGFVDNVVTRVLRVIHPASP